MEGAAIGRHANKLRERFMQMFVRNKDKLCYSGMMSLVKDGDTSFVVVNSLHARRNKCPGTMPIECSMALSLPLCRHMPRVRASQLKNNYKV